MLYQTSTKIDLLVFAYASNLCDNIAVFVPVANDGSASTNLHRASAGLGHPKLTSKSK